MLGSILSSVLLVLGCSFFAGMIGVLMPGARALNWHRTGGIYYHESTFPITGAQMFVSRFVNPR